MKDDLSFVFKFIKYWSVQNLLTILEWLISCNKDVYIHKFAQFSQFMFCLLHLCILHIIFPVVIVTGSHLRVCGIERSPEGCVLCNGEIPKLSIARPSSIFDRLTSIIIYHFKGNVLKVMIQYWTYITLQWVQKDSNQTIGFSGGHNNELFSICYTYVFVVPSNILC